MHVQWCYLISTCYRNQGAIVDYLLDKGANVNKQANNGLAALHRAAVKGHVNISKSLLAKGANIHLCSNTSGRSALHFAAWNGHLDTVKYLISEGAVVDKEDNDGNTALHKAAWNGHARVVDFLLQDTSQVIYEPCLHGIMQNCIVFKFQTVINIRLWS